VVLINLPIFGYLHSCLNHEIITISNFLKSKTSLKKNSLFPDISSISIKYHFFLALVIFDIYHVSLYGHTFLSTFNRDRKELCFRYGYNPSSKCHDTKHLNTSCSIISLSSKDVSYVLLNVIFVVVSSQPNNHMLMLCEDLDRSSKKVIFFNNVLRSKKLSSPHDFINHSRDFLFTAFSHLFRKFSRDAYFQFVCLSCCINSHISNQIHLIHKNHNLIFQSIAAT
jgi:hypothetical protein